MYKVILSLAVLWGVSLPGQNLPASYDPNRCYLETITSPRYEVVTKTFLTYTEADAPKYKHREKSILLSEAVMEWQLRTRPDCDAPDTIDCQYLNYEEVTPAKYATIYQPRKRKLGNPVTVELTVHQRKDVTKEFREVDCDSIQTALAHPLLAYAPRTILADSAHLDSVSDQLKSLIETDPHAVWELRASCNEGTDASQHYQCAVQRATQIAELLSDLGVPSEQIIISPPFSEIPEEVFQRMKAYFEGAHAARNNVMFCVIGGG